MKLTKTMKEILAVVSITATVVLVVANSLYVAVVIASKGIEEVFGR